MLLAEVYPFQVKVAVGPGGSLNGDTFDVDLFDQLFVIGVQPVNLVILLPVIFMLPCYVFSGYSSYQEPTYRTSGGAHFSLLPQINGPGNSLPMTLECSSYF